MTDFCFLIEDIHERWYVQFVVCVSHEIHTYHIIRTYFIIEVNSIVVLVVAIISVLMTPQT